MPTIPAPLTGSEPYRHRQVAESFGADAERYDRARPSYPGALVDRIAASIPGREVLDVGCGTGIAARQFQAAGCTVLGVEPDERMAALARRSGIEVEISKIEDWDPAGRAFGAVVAGQAWHWVDPVAGAARAAQALRPGGRLAVFWNAAVLPAELAEAFAGVYRRVEHGLPFDPSGMPAVEMYQAMCDKAAGGIRQAGGFGDPEYWRFDWDRRYTRDEWREQVPTFGGHNRIAPDKLRALLSGMGAVIDASGGTFVMHYATMTATAARAAEPQRSSG
jgi:SAM-dependent methyltransferase